METLVVKIDEIIPYWRNPRRIPDEAVNAVAESISRYGYQQPIVVDGKMVIVAGHTRYAALRRLGAEEVQIVVARDLTKQQADQLRVIDNRSGEYSSWDWDALVGELGALDAGLMRAYFPDAVRVDVPEAGTDQGEQHRTVDTEQPDQAAQDVDFICPSCYHSWTARVDRDAVLSGRIEA